MGDTTTLETLLDALGEVLGERCEVFTATEARAIGEAYRAIGRDDLGDEYIASHRAECPDDYEDRPERGECTYDDESDADNGYCNGGCITRPHLYRNFRGMTQVCQRTGCNVAGTGDACNDGNCEGDY